MQNQIAFDRKPEDLILDPYRSPSLRALRQPDYIWRPMEHTKILGFAASEHAEINDKIERYMVYCDRNKMFHKAIEFNSFPVLLTDVTFKKSFVSVDDKCLISGAAGMRLLNKYCLKDGRQNEDLDKALIDYFLRCQDEEGDKAVPVLERPLDPETPFAIECRNTFNYFHFVTESLCQLCLVEEAGVTGPIYMHFPNSNDKLRPFAMNFIEALFPELAHRVIFKRSPVHHEQAVTPYSFSSSFYQMPAAEVDLMDLYAPSNAYWEGRKASRSSHMLLTINSVDSSLAKLRVRALKAIEGKDFSHLPKRFWVGRDGGQSRTRTMKGEDDLVNMLQMFGFEHVAFERLTPLEQIAIMANAEMMVSYHGAGFTNMLFASPETYVVEIGTLQTALFRWGDFWRLANVAGCRYITFFADFNAEDPLREPVFRDDGIVPVHLSSAGLAQVMSFVVGVLGHVPHFSRPDEVQKLGVQLMKLGAHDRARQLFAEHAGMEQGHVGLSMAMAECHEHFKAPYEQLAALFSAYHADPTSWPILIRIVWCARSINHHDTLHAALLTLQDGFPERFAAFGKDRPWVRRVLGDDIRSEAS